MPSSASSSTLRNSHLTYSNSLVTLTISSFILVFDQADSSDPASKSVSKGKHILGYICTLGASAAYGLGLSLTQCAFQTVIKRETFSAIMDMIVYQSLVASCSALLGFFVSGQWKSLNKEMYELGVASYVLTLTWSAISWQIFNIGSMGLIMEVSSLLSNVISTLGLPLIPILSVIFFHDKMDGLKVTAMVLALWGFGSYAYPHYLEYCQLKSNGRGDVNEEDGASRDQVVTNG